MSQIEEIIKSISNDVMEEGYLEQKRNMERMLGLNAAAYRVQQASNGMSPEEKEKALTQTGKVLVQIKASLDEIERRMNGASEALKS